MVGMEGKLRRPEGKPELYFGRSAVLALGEVPLRISSYPQDPMDIPIRIRGMYLSAERKYHGHRRSPSALLACEMHDLGQENVS
jgi:hypothetical protein